MCKGWKNMKNKSSPFWKVITCDTGYFFISHGLFKNVNLRSVAPQKFTPSKIIKQSNLISLLKWEKDNAERKKICAKQAQIFTLYLRRRDINRQILSLQYIKWFNKLLGKIGLLKTCNI